ncbi:hypothetical protein C8F01DRAFT_1267551 [Mycena amicta]|nr:hypothetical protein C8F01DRAFT_1267551 [Mycena amicta]
MSQPRNFDFTHFTHFAHPETRLVLTESRIPTQLTALIQNAPGNGHSAHLDVNDYARACTEANLRAMDESKGERKQQLTDYLEGTLPEDQLDNLAKKVALGRNRTPARLAHMAILPTLSIDIFSILLTASDSTTHAPSRKNRLPARPSGYHTILNPPALAKEVLLLYSSVLNNARVSAPNTPLLSHALGYLDFLPGSDKGRGRARNLFNAVVLLRCYMKGVWDFDKVDDVAAVVESLYQQLGISQNTLGTQIRNKLKAATTQMRHMAGPLIVALALDPLALLSDFDLLSSDHVAGVTPIEAIFLGYNRWAQGAPAFSSSLRGILTCATILCLFESAAGYYHPRDIPSKLWEQKPFREALLACSESQQPRIQAGLSQPEQPSVLYTLDPESDTEPDEMEMHQQEQLEEQVKHALAFPHLTPPDPDYSFNPFPYCPWLHRSQNRHQPTPPHLPLRRTPLRFQMSRTTRPRIGPP